MNCVIIKYSHLKFQLRGASNSAKGLIFLFQVVLLVVVLPDSTSIVVATNIATNICEESIIGAPELQDSFCHGQGLCGLILHIGTIPVARRCWFKLLQHKQKKEQVLLLTLFGLFFSNEYLTCVQFSEAILPDIFKEISIMLTYLQIYSNSFTVLL